MVKYQTELTIRHGLVVRMIVVCYNQIEIKEGIVGKHISKYDIYRDKDTGELWIYRKGGVGEGIPTGLYIDRK